MRYLVAGTYAVVSCSLLTLLVDRSGGLVLLRAVVWLVAVGAPLLSVELRGRPTTGSAHYRRCCRVGWWLNSKHPSACAGGRDWSV